MAHYIARFMKDVLGENGHEAEICQRSIEIEASCLTHATELAKAKFCKTEKVGDWCSMPTAFTSPMPNSRPNANGIGARSSAA